ncbi:MAG: flagellar export chaperone FliS [Deltaproteobacteria bacterium]|nr:flagellar export chaperone FliS [Deltaproteobacteria bacterium]
MMRDYGTNAYTKAKVTTTANQKDLIVMAYDGILRFLTQAKEHMAQGEIEPAHNALVRARDIVEELAGTLNQQDGGVVAQNLWNLYVFFVQKITEANFTKDPSHVDGILPALMDLREAWASMEIPKDDTKAQALNHRVQAPNDSHRLSIAG